MMTKVEFPSSCFAAFEQLVESEWRCVVHEYEQRTIEHECEYRLSSNIQ
jgi:hypothetical protein